MKKLITILACCTAVLLAGYVGYRGYKVWKQNHMLSLARSFLAKKDSHNALLSVQQVLQANAQNVDACRLMAQLAEAAHSPSAVIWRSRVVELNPRSFDDRLTLARTAIVFHDYATATNAIGGVDEAGKKTPAYHDVAGSVALAGNQLVEAQAQFLEASRLDPTNAIPQLNLATVRLLGTNPLDQAEARIALQRIAADSHSGSLRCQALRELVSDALRGKQLDAALKFTDQLTRDTNSVFSDRLLRLDVLREKNDPQLASGIASAQVAATNSVPSIQEFAMWVATRTSPAESLAWLRSLPSAFQTNQSICMIAADCQTATKDWIGLQRSLAKQNWSELDFTRHAFLARALREQGLMAAAKTEWELAFKATGDSKQSLIVLLRTAAQWGWQNETEELLWAVVNRYPGETWAFQALNRALYASGRTRPLMMLYGQEFRRLPSNLDVKNNFAAIALLLDAQEAQPHQLAREVYEKSSTNAAYASTYALSLYLQKKNSEALKVMQKLTPKQLEDPSIAGYYGLILKANGDSSKAQAYLGWASKAQLLPEEQKLFARARTGT